MLFFKDVIENKGGHRLFYIGGSPLEREEDLHILYRMTWFATISDVTREANDGRGPVDFKVSRGNAGILKKLKLTDNRDVVLIDARKDNKPSGSKAK